MPKLEDILKFDTMHSLKQLSLKYLLCKHWLRAHPWQLHRAKHLPSMILTYSRRILQWLTWRYLHLLKIRFI